MIYPPGIPWQANEMPALAAGLGPKWRQYFFLVPSAYRFHGRLRQIKIDWPPLPFIPIWLGWAY